MYYLKKSHDSLIGHVIKVHLNDFIHCYIVSCNKLVTNQFIAKLYSQCNYVFEFNWRIYYISLATNHLATTHYMTTYKTIYIYFHSYDLFDK